MRIARKFGESGLLGLLMGVPVVNVIVMYYLAYSKPVSSRAFR